MDTRRSTTAYVFFLHGGAITCLSKRQSTVAASTREAEYIAAAETTKEALWLHVLLRDLGVSISTMKIYADNQSAIKLLKNPVSSLRSKHIHVAYHFAQERVARKEIEFQYIKTDEMLAVMLTKAVSSGKLKMCCGIGFRVTDFTSPHGSVEMSEQSCQVCTSRPQTHTPCPDQALVYFRPLPVVLPYYSN